jgi:hypothetical protein
MDALCRAVQALRRARLWDRATLAERSGLSVAEIREIENGWRWCDPLRGDALIRAFAQNDDEATALAILCAATFQAQWDAMKPRTSSRAGRQAATELGAITAPAFVRRRPARHPRPPSQTGDRCARARCADDRDSAARCAAPGVVLALPRHRHPKYAVDDPKAAVDGRYRCGCQTRAG